MFVAVHVLDLGFVLYDKLENSSRLAMGQKAHSAAVGGTQKDLMQVLPHLIVRV